MDEAQHVIKQAANIPAGNPKTPNASSSTSVPFSNLTKMMKYSVGARFFITGVFVFSAMRGQNYFTAPSGATAGGGSAEFVQRSFDLDVVQHDGSEHHSRDAH